MKYYWTVVVFESNIPAMDGHGMFLSNSVLFLCLCLLSVCLHLWFILINGEMSVVISLCLVWVTKPLI